MIQSKPSSLLLHVKGPHPCCCSTKQMGKPADVDLPPESMAAAPDQINLPDKMYDDIFQSSSGINFDACVPLLFCDTDNELPCSPSANHVLIPSMPSTAAFAK